jgi:hypothetical protein
VVAQNDAKKFYTIKWTVTQNNPVQGVVQIVLAAKWNEGASEKQIKFETYR